MKVMFPILAGFMVAGSVYAKVAVIIDEEPAAKIEKIIVKKDHIELVSNGKTTVVNYEDVLKNKNDKLQVVDKQPAPTPAKVTPAEKSAEEPAKEPAKEPETLEQAFAGNPERCVFKRNKPDLNRLKIYKQMSYKVFAEGDLLKTVKFKGRYYAKDSNGVVYETHWEVGKDFSKYLLTEADYFDKLSERQKDLKRGIDKKDREIEDIEAQLTRDRKRQDEIKANQAYIDNANGNNNNNSYYNKNKNNNNNSFGSEMERLNKRIRKQEEDLRGFRRQKIKMQDAIASLQKLEADVKKKIAAEQTGK